MRLFQCGSCGNIIHFDNRTCQRCGRSVGFSANDILMYALEPAAESSIFTSVPQPKRKFRFCANAQFDACNWLCSADNPSIYCHACQHNGVVPNVGDAQNVESWRLIEAAKRRLFYSLIRWRLPCPTRNDDPVHGLVFEFLADAPLGGGHVMTGHDEGRITIALAEANDFERERRRVQMGEPYRTLLGHFRHEIGHYYWDLLVKDRTGLDRCRVVFGDERKDYQEALSRHYQNGPPPDWPTRFVSAYASTHPWEDFAETWAHYFHLVDGLETAAAFGVRIEPAGALGDELSARMDFDPYRISNCDRLIESWLTLTIALNSINRSVGLADVYPFVWSPPVIDKIKFVHELIADVRQERGERVAPELREPSAAAG